VTVNFLVLQTLFFIFLLAASVQVVYIIILWISISKKRFDQAVSSHPVSVIVCAHDEEQNLRELIPILLKQQHPEFEVIIVNDRSNDGTYDFLLKETKKDNRLKMVDVKRTPDHVNGKKFGLTLGIKAAKYDWVLLTDADCRPNTEQWMRSMSDQFSETKNFVLGYSAYEKRL
jgi:glycosyltransferase involved in cell wall biosynthesis